MTPVLMLYSETHSQTHLKCTQGPGEDFSPILQVDYPLWDPLVFHQSSFVIRAVLTIAEYFTAPEAGSHTQAFDCHMFFVSEIIMNPFSEAKIPMSCNVTAQSHMRPLCSTIEHPYNILRDM